MSLLKDFKSTDHFALFESGQIYIYGVASNVVCIENGTLKKVQRIRKIATNLKLTTMFKLGLRATARNIVI